MAIIEVERRGDVAEILLNRPEKKNCLRKEDFAALRTALEALGSDLPRAVLVRGAGEAFCAGLDLGSVDPAAVDGEGILRDAVNPAVRALRALPVPTIAAVAGPCLGGGFGIAFACDVVLAAEDAVIGSPFRNLGCVPDAGTHSVLLDRLGYHRACELIYTGQFLSGAEAARVGLVNRAYPAHRLLAEARDMANHIATGPTAAFRSAKSLLQRGGTFDVMLDEEARLQGLVIRTRDAIEGFSAFQERRKPSFAGR
jgi:2-(1,2-epoxy-1,2-dihydrophenyl)acetyl-CoA isomerase